MIRAAASAAIRRRAPAAAAASEVGRSWVGVGAVASAACRPSNFWSSAPLPRRDEDGGDDGVKSRRISSTAASRRTVTSHFHPTTRRRLDPIAAAATTPSPFVPPGGFSVRHYHSTPRNEVLPLVALILVVGVTARYSYMALQRMDDEWEEYEVALREYRAARGEVDADFASSDSGEGRYAKGRYAKGVSADGSKAAVDSIAGLFRGGVMGVDLGTVNVRISHGHVGGGGGDAKKPVVVVDREGGRSTPAAVYFEDDDDGGRSAVWGRLAAARLHERDNVLVPHRLLSGSAEGQGEDQDKAAEAAVEEIVRSACRNALDQVLPSSGSGSGSGVPSLSPLFVVDPWASGGGYNVRPVFTFPPIEDGNTGEWVTGYISRYTRAVSQLSSPDSIAVFVPEPVAAVAGARSFGVLPTGGNGTVLVIDVGGNVTAASLVAPSESEMAKHEGDVDVLESLRLPSLGGETLVEALVSHLARSFFGVGDVSEVKDGMALQRLYDAARGALMEVSGGKARVQVNIPYLTVNEQMMPRHLDMGVSARVLEAEVDDLIRYQVGEYEKAGVLSKSMPRPKDLSSTLSSLIMRVLEESGTNPFSLEAVLVVGGGARSPIVQAAVRRGLGSIGGEQFVQGKVVIPRDELVEELVVLGAAVVGGKS